MTPLNEPSVDFHLKLNQQQFNIPVELLKRNWDKCNTLIHQYSSQLNKNFETLQISLQNPENDGQSIEQLNDIIHSVDDLQKKLTHLNNNELEILRRIEKRVDYFVQFENLQYHNNTDGILKWYRSYTDVLIADYLVRHSSTSLGKGTKTEVNAGVEFINRRSLSDLLDYDVLIEANTISMELIENKNLRPLLAWIEENYKYLSEKGSSLQFQALLQQYIELIRCSNYKGAISCFQKHLRSFIDRFPLELKLAAGILVFFKSCPNQRTNHEVTNQQKLYQLYFRKPMYKTHPLSLLSANNVARNAELHRYGPLLSHDRWETINKMFLQEFYSLYKISYHDPLLIYISLGISALKTKDCSHTATNQLIPHENPNINEFINERVVNSECPICDPNISPLSENLPYAHHIQSSLFDNPVMLPNGNIYDSEKLVTLAKRLNKLGMTELNGNKVMDPVDKSIYEITDFITMYPT